LLERGEHAVEPPGQRLGPGPDPALDAPDLVLEPRRADGPPLVFRAVRARVTRMLECLALQRLRAGLSLRVNGAGVRLGRADIERNQPRGKVPAEARAARRTAARELH